MYAILHQHFESQLRLLKIIKPQELEKFYSIYTNSNFLKLSPAERLKYLDSNIPKTGSDLFTKENFNLVVKQLVDEILAYNIQHVDLRLGLKLSKWVDIDIVKARKIFDEILNDHRGCSISFVGALNFTKGEDCLKKNLKLIHSDEVLSSIVAIDINASEENYDLLHKYKKSITNLRTKNNKKINVHLGEFTSNDFNWMVLRMIKPNRIGHGIKLLKDKDMIRFLKEKDICLDMCPTSNQLLGVVDWLKENPIKFALSNNIPVTINTDDPILFNTNIESEIKLANLSNGDMEKLSENSAKYSYAKK